MINLIFSSLGGNIFCSDFCFFAKLASLLISSASFTHDSLRSTGIKVRKRNADARKEVEVEVEAEDEKKQKQKQKKNWVKKPSVRSWQGFSFSF